jgi:glycosyltransferase involved in cell wall biosynthesis
MLNKGNKENIMITFYGTVYNSVKYIEKSLKSIIHTTLKLKAYGIESEIVIVDNYSDDGTWEIMQKLREVYGEKIKLKLVRYKSSRGLGRNIALKLSHGNFIFFISDLDVEYNSEKLFSILISYINLQCLIKKYIQLNHNTCFYIFITPRDTALNVGGILDLNRTEDIEFGARLTRECVMLPVLEGLRPVEFSEFMRPLETTLMLRSRLFVSTYPSERRYSKGLMNYLKRELRNKIDMIYGMGYTPTKIVRECKILHKFREVEFLLCIFYHLLFFALTMLMRRSINVHSILINNGSLCDIAMSLNYIALVVNLLRRKLNRINLHSNSYELIKYIKAMIRNKGYAVTYYLSLRPEVLEKALKGEFFYGERHASN